MEMINTFNKSKTQLLSEELSLLEAISSVCERQLSDLEKSLNECREKVEQLENVTPQKMLPMQKIEVQKARIHALTVRLDVLFVEMKTANHKINPIRTQIETQKYLKNDSTQIEKETSILRLDFQRIIREGKSISEAKSDINASLNNIENFCKPKNDGLKK